MIGYITMTKVDNKLVPQKHRVCSIDYYPYVIFPTLKEALDYGNNINHIKK